MRYGHYQKSNRIADLSKLLRVRNALTSDFVFSEDLILLNLLEIIYEQLTAMETPISENTFTMLHLIGVKGITLLIEKIIFLMQLAPKTFTGDLGKPDPSILPLVK